MTFLGYVRVSRVGDREETLISPELQSKRIAEFAAVKGWEVEMLPPELDVSGGKSERPILGAAIERIEAGECEGLIVAQLDRLSRLSLVDAYKIIERIEGAGGELIAVAENFDASTPEGEMTRDVSLTLARMQRRRYQQQFAAAKERAVRFGIWPFPKVPLGYRKGEGRKLEPSKDAPRVVRAFETRAAGNPWSVIAPMVDRGLSGAARLIANRVYLGEIHYGEWVNLKAHPPIVERSLWEAAQIKHPRPHRGRRRDAALLAGILRCAGCRGLLTRDANVYRCVGRRAKGRCPSPAIISASLVEPYVERTVLAHIRDLAFAAKPDTDALLDAERRLEEADAELAAFQRVTSALSGEFSEGLRTRAEAVEATRRDVAAIRLTTTQQIAGNVDTLWPDLSIEERRHVLRSSLGVVWVRKGRGPAPERVKISTATPPGLPQPGGRGPYAVEPIGWENVEGEVVPRPEDLGDSDSGAGT